MNESAVSIVIPTYNRAHLLARALSSALEQARPGDEILVVDDGSTDGTRELLATYEAPVRAIVTANGGAGAARNVGIAESRHPLVAFLDSDDEWTPGSLEARRRLLASRPDVLYCFGDFAVSLPDGRTLHHYLPHWHRDTRPWDEILPETTTLGRLAGPDTPLADARVHIGDLYACEMRANYILTSSFVVRREGAGEALEFEADLENGEDWACFGRVAARGPGAYLDAETAWQHGDARGRISCAGEAALALGHLRVLERVWGQDPRFLAQHGEAYAQACSAARRRLVRALLGAGRTREAAALLRDLPDAPRTYRLLAAVPQPLLGGALALRRMLRRVSGRERHAARAWE